MKNNFKIILSAVFLALFAGCPGFFADGNNVITLDGNRASFTGTNINIISSPVYGTIAEITGNGTYTVKGTLSQGFVSVAKRDLDVTIILDGANIFCRNYSALVCLKNSNVTIVLAEGSVNKLSDGGIGMVDGRYPLGYDDTEQPNAALLIRRNLTIKGSGKLEVDSNGHNGIASRSHLRIEDGDITVSARNNAIKGNDSVTITGGRFNIVSHKDAIVSETILVGLGAINISGGEFDITAGNDGIKAATSLTLDNASFKVKTGGGSTAGALGAGVSAKGFRASKDIIINSGSFDIDSNDDGINSSETVTINGGTFEIASSDDGIQADKRLTIHSGNINIRRCFEGIESYDIDLYGGFLKIYSLDDGINVAGGADLGHGHEISGSLTITGGEYYIESVGDGIDSNGNILMTGGTVVIFGPTYEPEVPIDYIGTFTMTGGTIAALGLQGEEAQQPSSSTQYSFLARFPENLPASSLINVSSESGKEIITIESRKPAMGLVLCSPELEQGAYRISTGGAHSGTLNHLNLMTGGSYSGGTVIKTVTLNDFISQFD